MTINKKYLPLTQEELEKRTIMEKYCSKHIKQSDWAIKLWISIRQFRRLVKSYKEQWDIWLMHWLRGKNSNHHKDKKKELEIIEIMNETIYHDFWPTFLSEELAKRGIKISVESLRKLMIREGKREGKKQRDMQLRNRRQRKAIIWEMIQYDGSYHHWFEERLDEEFCLLVAIDDATGKLMQLWMSDNEWWVNTIVFWIRYILRRWVPESIYVDRFATYKVNNKKATDDRELVTQFERCLRKLWCKLIKANSPQAKWRVERANQTLQDRMVKMMRLDWISDIDSANKRMEEVYIPRHNKKFWVKSEISWDKHRILTKEEKDVLKRTFSLEETRVVQRDYVIQYKNRFYQLQPEWITRMYTKSRCIIQETMDWEIQVLANEKIIPYIEIDAKGRKLEQAILRWNIYQQKLEKTREKEIRRDEERHIISKQIQARARAEKLIEKLKISRLS